MLKEQIIDQIGTLVTVSIDTMFIVFVFLTVLIILAAGIVLITEIYMWITKYFRKNRYTSFLTRHKDRSG